MAVRIKPYKRKSKGRWMWALLICMALSLAVVIFIPQFVSTGPVKERILTAVNLRLPGKVSVDKWSFSWFGACDLSGVSFSERPGGLEIKNADIRISKGIFELALGRGRLGRVVLSHPEIYLPIPAREKNGGKQPSSPKKPDSGGESTAGQGPPQSGLAIPPVQGELNIVGGRLFGIFAQNDIRPMLKDLSANLGVSGDGAPISYEIGFASPDGSGKLSGAGEWIMSAVDGDPVSDMVPRGDFSIENWQIGELLSIGAMVADLPTATGRLYGKLTLADDSSDPSKPPGRGLRLKGNLELADLQVSGGPLGSDAPVFDRITLAAEMVKNKSGLQLPFLKIQSPVVEGTIQADYSGGRDYRLSGQLVADLAGITARFPRTLNLKADTKITEGTLKLSADVEAQDASRRFSTTARLDRLKGVSSGKPLAWDQPLTFEAEGAGDDQGIRLDRFSLRSAFIRGDGKGDFNRMEVVIGADLERALAEAAKFVELEGYRANGLLDMKLSLERNQDKKEGGDASGNGTAAGPLKLSARMKIEDFRVKQRKKVLVPKQKLAINISTTGLLTDDRRLKELVNTRMDYAARVGKGELKAGRVLFSPAGKIPAIHSFSHDGQTDLKQLTHLLGMLELLPPETRLAGQSNLNFAGSLAGDVVVIDDLKAETTDFHFQQGKKNIRDKELLLNGRGRFNLSENSLEWPSLGLEGKWGDIRLAGLNLTKDRHLSTKAIARLDLARLQKVVREFAALPQQTNLSGQARLEVDLNVADGGNNFVVTSRITPFRMRKDQSVVMADDDIRLLAEGHWRPEESQVQLKKVKLTSSILKLDAGITSRVVDDSPQVTGQGRIESDLAGLTSIMHHFKILPLTTRFKGKLNSSIKGSLSNRKLALKEAAVDISKFFFQQDQKSLSQEQVSLKGAGTMDMTRRSIDFSPLSLETPSGRVQFETLKMADWSDLFAGGRTQATASVDLEGLLAALADFRPLPQDTRLSGRAHVDVAVEQAEGRRQQLRLSTELSGLHLETGGAPAVSEDHVKLEISALHNPADNSTRAETIRIASQPLSLAATGSFVRDAAGKGLLKSQGQLGLDLELVARYINTFADNKVEMAGKSERPFQVRILAGDRQWSEWWRHADFKAAFHADRLNGFGMRLTSLDIPVSLKKAKAHLDLKAQVNQGVLHFDPTVDLTGGKPALVLPPDSAVLTRAQITQELADELLALIHPVFKGAALAQGLVDIEFSHFNWPLDSAAKNDIRFGGRMRLSNVRLDASGLLFAALEAAKIKEREVVIDERVIEFTAREGRVECTRLKTKVGDTHLTLAGSMGFDKTLDYSAQLPITQDLVGKDIYPYLEGTVIRLPIGGTVTRPDISTRSVQRAVGDLVKQAGRKKLEDAAGKLLKNLFN